MMFWTVKLLAVVLCLLLVKEAQPMSVPETECDTPIIPTDTVTTPTPPPPPPPIQVCGSLTFNEARAFTRSNIQPKLDRIFASASTVFNHTSLSYISESELTLTSWRNRREPVEDTIAFSIYRMKCVTPSVIRITANETDIELMDEEVPHFANEFQVIQGDLDVLLELRQLVSRDDGISACIVPNNVVCVSFDGLERGLLVKSISYELKNLSSEVQAALKGRYNL